MRKPLASIAKWVGAVAGLGLGTYAAYVAVARYRYGRPSAPSAADEDELLDRFMPSYDVVERHRVRVRAPAAVTFAAAKEMDLTQLPVVRTIFKAREMLLRSAVQPSRRPPGIVEETKALGWVVLHELPDREIVMGAAARPWEADVVFRSIPPEAFAGFCEPGYVKIVWTLRADPAGEASSIFRTETRAEATDSEARRRFRRYWSLLSPGIILIRWLSLLPLKREAERRAAG